jgi:hypothetical protein
VAAFDPNWEQSIHGLMLTATARRAGLPLSPSDVVLTGLSDQQVREAHDIVRRAGFDPAYVRSYRVPDAIPVPPAYWAALGGLGLLLLVTVLTTTRAHALAMRRYVAGLVATGLPRRWVRHVLLLQAWVIVVAGLALGALLGAMPPILIALQIEGYVIDVPWLLVAAVVAATLAVVALGVGLGTRHLAARDRTASPGTATGD